MGKPLPLWQSNAQNLLAGSQGSTFPRPVTLRIAALNIDAPIEAYGVNKRTGQMDVPHNVTDVAWYRFGPTPGQAGSAVLAAAHLRVVAPRVYLALEGEHASDERLRR